MSDERDERLDRLEQMVGDLGRRMEGALSRRGGPTVEDERGIRRDAKRIEDEFTEDELNQIRGEREYNAFKRNADRYAAELEREALAAGAAGDDEDDDEDEGDDEHGDDEDDEGDGGKPAAKRKPAAGKRKPPARPRGGRHEPPPPAEDPPPPADKPQGGVLSWLFSD